MKPCVICERETINVFNIALKMKPVCEPCANAIAWQQVDWLFTKAAAGFDNSEKQNEKEH